MTITAIVALSGSLPNIVFFFRPTCLDSQNEKWLIHPKQLFEMVVSTRCPFTSDVCLITHYGRLGSHAFHATFDFRLLRVAVIIHRPAIL